MTGTKRNLLLTLLLTGGPAFAAACDSPTEPTGPDTQVVDQYREANVLFTAVAEPRGPDVLRVWLIALNETDFEAQATILGGNCMLRPRVYDSRGGTLVWSAFDLFNVCQEPTHTFQLGGGDQETAWAEFTPGLPDGAYFVTLTIGAMELVELAAGAVVWPAPPVPAS